MFARISPALAAVLAMLFVVLCTSTTLRAEDDDDGSAIVVPLTHAQKTAADAVQATPIKTVPLTSTRIVPSEFNGDVRNLPPGPPRYLHIWNEYEEPPSHKPPPATDAPVHLAPVELDAPMPTPTHNFPGLSFTTPLGTDEAGAGWPPDTNGDVGPVYYIQAVNDAWVFSTKRQER